MFARTDPRLKENGDQDNQSSAQAHEPAVNSTRRRPRRSRTDTAELLQSHGLAVTRRQLLFVAYLWTMSNGGITRRIGRLAWLLLPISGPVHLLTAAAVRHRLALHGAAVVHVRRLADPVKMDTWSILGIAVPLTAAVWLPILSAPFYLPQRFVIPGILAVLIAFSVLIPDLIIGPARQSLRRLQQRVPAIDRITPNADVTVLAGLAAYPRETGQGLALLRTLHRAFDDARIDTVLDARTDRLQRWYRDLGYESLAGQRMRRPAQHPTGDRRE